MSFRFSSVLRQSRAEAVYMHNIAIPKIMSSQIKNLKPRTNKEKIKHLGVLFFSLFLTLARVKTYNLPPTTFLFSAETSAKPVKQDDGSIAFFDNKGDYLFQLDKPFMYDAKGNRSEEVKIDITPVRKIKSPQRNNGFNFKFLNSNFESIFNDLIFKHLNIQPFIQNSKSDNPFKIKNSGLFQNSKF